MQTVLQLSTPEQLAKCWAFAVDKGISSFRTRNRIFRSKSRCVITACSKEARALGVKAGMQYEDAKLLIPELRIMICNWK